MKKTTTLCAALATLAAAGSAVAADYYYERTPVRIVETRTAYPAPEYREPVYIYGRGIAYAPPQLAGIDSGYGYAADSRWAGVAKLGQEAHNGNECDTSLHFGQPIPARCFSYSGTGAAAVNDTQQQSGGV